MSRFMHLEKFSNSSVFAIRVNLLHESMLIKPLSFLLDLFLPQSWDFSSYTQAIYYLNGFLLFKARIFYDAKATQNIRAGLQLNRLPTTQVFN